MPFPATSPPQTQAHCRPLGPLLTCTRQKLFHLQNRCHTSSRAAAGGGGLWQRREASSQRPPGTKSEGPAEQGRGHPLEGTVRLRRKGGTQVLMVGPRQDPRAAACAILGCQQGGGRRGAPSPPLQGAHLGWLGWRRNTWPGHQGAAGSPSSAAKPALRQTEVTPGAVTPRARRHDQADWQARA